MTKLIIGIFAVIMIALGGIFYVLQQAPEVTVLTGTVRYNERMALPPGSTLTVELREIVGPDAPVTTVSKYQYTTGGENVPLPYTLTYDPKKIVEGRKYTLFAEILVDGEVRYITNTDYEVLTATSNESGVDMLLVAAPSSASGEPMPVVASDGKKPPSPSPLIGTTWVWKETVEGDVDTVAKNDLFVLSFTESEVRSTTDCNSLSGTYLTADNNITFSSFAMTEMYCEGSLEASYAADLGKAQQFTVLGTALTLTIGDGNEMRFMKMDPPVAPSGSNSDPDEPVSSLDDVGVSVEGGTGIDVIQSE